MAAPMSELNPSLPVVRTSSCVIHEGSLKAIDGMFVVGVAERVKLPGLPPEKVFGQSFVHVANADLKLQRLNKQETWSHRQERRQERCQAKATETATVCPTTASSQMEEI